MKEKLNKILGTVISIGAIFIIGYLQDSKSYEEKITEKNVKSVVLRKFINYDNHGMQYIIFDKDSITINKNWDSYINVGDSIIKPRGSTKVIVKNTAKYFEFDYSNPGQLPLP